MFTTGIQTCTWVKALFALFIFIAFTPHPGVPRELHRIHVGIGGSSSLVLPTMATDQETDTTNQPHHPPQDPTSPTAPTTRIKNTVDKLNRLHSHHNYLVECQSKKIAPKGLFLKKSCALDLDTQTDKKWATTLWHATCQLRDIAIEGLNRKINVTEQLLNNTKEELFEQYHPIN